MRRWDCGLAAVVCKMRARPEFREAGCNMPPQDAPVGAFLRFNSGPAPSSQVICHMHIKKSKWKQKGGLRNTEAAHKMGSGYIPYPSACHRMGDGKHGGKKLKTLRAHRKTKP